MGELIAILSGKGGTGKTSVCAGLATALAADGKRVLCIDCDVGLRNLDIALAMSDCGALTFLDVSSGAYELSQASEHPYYPGLFFLTAPTHCPPESIDRDQFGEFLWDAKREFDYILLDAPAGVDAGFRLTASFADRCILVTGSGPSSVRDVSRVGELLELMGKSNVRLIVNRVSHRMVGAMDTTVDDVMDAAGLPLLGVVPEDPNVTLAATHNRPLLMYSCRCPAALAVARISKRLQGVPVPISLR
ncbi:MAG: P-loop NTPase [Oscillospiraceae bacterium]|nr:P-loop NTPase [Oscillospiraceae bacterium]